MNEMIQHDDRDTIIAGLREQLRQSREEASGYHSESVATTRGVANLRRQLQPLYSALQQVFGEIEGMDLEESPAVTRTPQKSAVWDDWKSKLGGAAAKIIDILHLHGELTQDQLRIHVGTSRMQTIYDAVSRLNKAGIINKNGGKISLKEL